MRSGQRNEQTPSPNTNLPGGGDLIVSCFGGEARPRKLRRFASKIIHSAGQDMLYGMFAAGSHPNLLHNPWKSNGQPLKQLGTGHGLLLSIWLGLPQFSHPATKRIQCTIIIRKGRNSLVISA